MVITNHLVNASALDPESVLVDSDDGAVLQDRLVVGLNCSKIDRHEEGRREDRPHCHLGLRLLVAKAEISDDQL